MPTTSAVCIGWQNNLGTAVFGSIYWSNVVLHCHARLLTYLVISNYCNGLREVSVVTAVENLYVMIMYSRYHLK
jgi:hypothetical protein